MTNSILKMRLLIQLFVLLFSSVNNGHRLGSSMKPIHYDLLLLPIISGGSPRLCGHVLVDLEPTMTTNVVTFHGVEISILDVSIEQVLDTEKKINSDRSVQLEDLCFSGLFEIVNEAHTVIHEDVERQQISVILKQTLIKGHRYRVGLFYVAKVRDDNRGFFRANYKNDNTSCCHEGWFGGTQMEATNARRVLPCLDEPGFKTTFDVTIGHNRVMSALSNMPEIATRPMKNTREWMWTIFSRSPPMPTYLLAMFVTDYDKVERIYKVCKRTIRMRFWGRRDQLRHLEQSMAVVPDMLNYMETYVRQPFSLPKIDFISAPLELDFEAMENWGLVLFRENRLNFNEETGSEDERFQVVQTMAHELAHQFFGNLVTSDWWSDIWFNEGFCGVFENDLVQHALPNLVFRAEMSKFSSIRTAMKIEEHVHAASVIRAVETADDAEKMFDSITYSKGSGLLLMLRNSVGPQNFRNAVVTYMERYQFQNANSQRFMDILDEEIHKNRDIGRGMNVTKIMHSWTSQQSYPIVRCIRTGNGRVRLSQTPHPVRNNITSDETTNQLWWIPISMTDGNQPDFTQQGTYPRVWLTPERPSLEIPYFPTDSGHDSTNDEDDNWILINGEFSGYVRVLYDDYNWRLISRQLVVNHTVIPQVTRAQLIDDAFTLALGEYLEYKVVLELIEYLTSVSDEFVRATTQFHLKWMRERAKQNESLLTLFEEYTGRLKFERMDDEHPNEYNNLVRTDGFEGEGCSSWSDGVCVDQILGMFRAEMDGTITAANKKYDFTKLC
ncbi:hypothetical protein OUZ56_015313 [Daphnia magna]|uniref:Aminopeptidase n=1 Tax=Daphnia magna TaxID=35525 RepID=A0ABR0AMG3_9CRUS|nr:hypothetical protein OUZ56_015313 [Daphnia magna]